MAFNDVILFNQTWNLSHFYIQIIYRNPTFRDRECVMSFEKFNKARTSYGTDEDIIFVYSREEPKS